MSSGVLREVNLRVYEVARSFDFGDAGEFLCECDQPDCGHARVEMRLTDFVACLAVEGSAIVAPGHQPPEAEVVCERAAYLLVRDTRHDA